MARPQNPNLNFNSLLILISRLRRKLDTQIEAEVHYRGYKNFKSSYLPVFLLLYKESSTTVQIAEACGVSKQASSKLLLEMNRMGLVKTQINREDRRSNLVLLSAKGRRMATEARKCLHRLSENYKSLMGRNRYEQLVEHLDVLLVLHE